MHIFVVYSVFLVLCLYSVCGYRVKRIVNGEFVEIGVQPRVASLCTAPTMKHLCGATVLSAHHALTAAHCVQESGEYVLMLNNCEYRSEIPVVDVVVHGEYNKRSRAHDIAILRINATFPASFSWIQDEILPRNTLGAAGNCIAYGYGAAEFESKQTSNHLQSAHVSIISLDRCQEKIGEYIAPAYDSGMMCAVGMNRADTCQGDSGGPLLCNGVLEGVCSHGMSCAVPDLPAIYTSVGCHKKWIQSVIENNSCRKDM